MSKTIMNALRFVAAIAFAYVIVYTWTTIRPDDDMTILAGIGITTAAITYVLLYMFGKGGGS